jgi:hypothetical protein
MRLAEIDAEIAAAIGIPSKLTDTADEIIDEAEPQKPLNAKQAAARALKLRRASDQIADIRATNAIKLRAAQKRLSDL